MNLLIYKLQKAIIKFKRKHYLPRIMVNPELCFSDEEYELRINGLTTKSMKAIRKNFSSIVKEIISLSASGKEIYVECIGTAGEHFVTTLKQGERFNKE